MAGNPDGIREIREANPEQVLVWETGRQERTEERERNHSRTPIADTANSKKQAIGFGGVRSPLCAGSRVLKLASSCYESRSDRRKAAISDNERFRWQFLFNEWSKFFQ
jgi:hypothetical protein